MTLAHQVPVQPRVLTLTSQKNQKHLHKMIAYKAKALITAQKQKLGVKATLVVNGMKILIYTASEDLLVPEKSPRGLLQYNQTVRAIAERNLRKKGKGLMKQRVKH